MKRSLPLESSFFERLCVAPDYDIIVIGTGAMARDLREKLLLLGLKAPFLIGNRSEPDQNIRHYDELAALGDPKRFRFIMCCDVDEIELIEPARIAVHRLLGFIGWNDSRLIDAIKLTVMEEYSGKRITDALNGNVYLRNNKPYVVYGDVDDAEALAIHLVSGCSFGGVYNVTPRMPVQILAELLAQAGFRCVLYSWAHPSSLIGDFLIKLIRDIMQYKCDLLITSSGINAINPLRIADTNLLATDAGSLGARQKFVQMCENYRIPASNGVDHHAGLLSVRKAQQKVFITYAQLYGFKYWDILRPNSKVLSRNHNNALGPVSDARFVRIKKQTEDLLATLDNRYMKDYRGLFDEAQDIYTLFHDGLHYSEAGNRIVAERLKADIVDEFQNSVEIQKENANNG